MPRPLHTTASGKLPHQTHQHVATSRPLAQNRRNLDYGHVQHHHILALTKKSQVTVVTTTKKYHRHANKLAGTEDMETLIFGKFDVW